MKAGKLIKELIRFKKRIKKNDNINKKLMLKIKEFNKFYNVKIEYLELRNINNFKLTNKLKNSKIFIAFYLNKIRLIDNI